MQLKKTWEPQISEMQSVTLRMREGMMKTMKPSGEYHMSHASSISHESNSAYKRTFSKGEHDLQEIIPMQRICEDD